MGRFIFATNEITCGRPTRTVKPTTRKKVITGTIVRHKERTTDFYIVSMVEPDVYQLIALDSGNRWDKPSRKGNIIDLNEFEIIPEGTLITIKTNKPK